MYKWPSLRKHPFLLALRRWERFARRKRPQRRTARRNGCFRRPLCFWRDTQTFFLCCRGRMIGHYALVECHRLLWGSRSWTWWRFKHTIKNVQTSQESDFRLITASKNKFGEIHRSRPSPWDSFSGYYFLLDAAMIAGAKVLSNPRSWVYCDPLCYWYLRRRRSISPGVFHLFDVGF